jgi:hypothetical protein
LCLFLGREDDYRRARRELLDRFAASTDRFVAERTGRACLLFPASKDELRMASALIDRAVGPENAPRNWAYPYFLFAKGLADYRAGRFDDAIAVMEGNTPRGLGPSPRLVLALALHQKGQKEQAVQALAAAVASYDWSAARANEVDAWIAHILRREAEALILPKPRQGAPLEQE